MKVNPLVSIIIPVYNVGKYLDTCLKSVIGQSYQNIEIILVDDGSTDNSGEKCDEWSKKDERIKILHQKNVGLNGARHAGFKLSSGECITFVDADDILQDNYAERLLYTIIDMSTDVSVCAYQRFDKMDDITYQHPTNKVGKYLRAKTLYYMLTGATYWSKIHPSFLTNVTNKMYRRKIVEKINWDNAEYSIGEDDFWMLEAFNIANDTAVIDEALYYYRSTPVSNSTDSAREFKRRGKIISAFDMCNDFQIKALGLLGQSFSNEIYFRTLSLYDYYISRYIQAERFNDELLMSLRDNFLPSVECYTNIKRHPIDKKLLVSVKRNGAIALITYKLQQQVDYARALEVQNENQSENLHEIINKQQREIDMQQQELLSARASVRRLVSNIKRKIIK